MCSAKRLSEKERKNEIMNSAIKVISEKGLESTTMEDIIAGTTLSKGGVYHYYGGVIEVFRDIMLRGNEYRNENIKEHLDECETECKEQFIAKQVVDKILDNNPYTTLYTEFLRTKKRNPKLNKLMEELQEQAKEGIKATIGNTSNWISDKNIFQFLSDFINAMIMASDVLEAKESLERNRKILEQMVILILGASKGSDN